MRVTYTCGPALGLTATAYECRSGAPFPLRVFHVPKGGNTGCAQRPQELPQEQLQGLLA